jgi:hypothetical protein
VEHETWRQHPHISFISGRDKAICGVTQGKANFPARSQFIGQRVDLSLRGGVRSNGAFDASRHDLDGKIPGPNGIAVS